METDDDSDDSVQGDVKERRSRRKGLLEEGKKRRESGDQSTSRSSLRDEDSEGSRVSKRNSSLTSKILASKNSRKSKTDDCDKCGKKNPASAKETKRKRRRNSVYDTSDDDSSPPRRRKKQNKPSDHSSQISSLSSSSKELDPSSTSSGSTDHSYVEGANLAVNPKAMSKKAMILQKRDAETRNLLKLLSEPAGSSPDNPPAYRYGEMVELRSPTYVLLNNQGGNAEIGGQSETSEHSDSSSTTLSIGTESAPPRHFDGWHCINPEVVKTFPPFAGEQSYLQLRSPSSTSSASSSRAVGDSSNGANDVNGKPPSPSYSDVKPKIESTLSDLPSIASPSSDSSDSASSERSPAHLNDWPELSAPQPGPGPQSLTQQSSPPNLHRFDDSPIITLEHSPLGTLPHYSSWDSSTDSPTASPPRLKSIVNRVSNPPTSPHPPSVIHNNSCNTTSDEDDEVQ